MSEPLMTLSEFAESLSQEATIKGAASIRFSSVSFDSRKIEANGLFFAIKGARDGHDFVQAAADRGAAAAVVEHMVPVSIPQIIVKDAREALLESAGKWRSRFNITVAAVAGSNGKTTTTQMILSIIKSRFDAASWVGTEGNLNNDLGVSLMLWKLRPSTEVAVFEVGMNHIGEMAPLVRMIAPTVGVVTNTQRDHQEFLASLEETASDNGTVFSALPAGGTAVINDDDLFAQLWKRQADDHRIITFGRPDSQVWGEKSEGGFELHTPQGHIHIDLHVPGDHNIRNAVCAAAVSYAMGRDLSDIKEGLESFRAVAHRSCVHNLRNGSVLIDDSYNANPDSMCAALDLLSTYDMPKVFVMGDMGELGVKSMELHREVGQYAFNKKIDHFLSIGNRTMDADDAFGEGARHFETQEELKEALYELMNKEPVAVLLKASNFMKLYKIADQMIEEDKKDN